jgi:hypothetical protein
MKKKNKKKKIYNEQTRRDWDYAYRSLLEYSNKKIHCGTER